MEEIGQVIKQEGNEALVKIERHSLCSKCHNKCQLAIGNSHEKDEIEVKVSNPVGATSGQKVKIKMGNQPVVMSSIIVYLIPLFSLITGYFFINYLIKRLGYFPTEGSGIIGALLFLGLSFLLIRFIDRLLGKQKKYQPVIKKVID